MVLVGIALTNFEMNVKSINSSSDSLGIALGVVATLLLLGALIWSGIRIFKIDDTLQGVMLETAKTTSLVFIILLGAAMLTAAFRAFGGEELVKEFLLGLPGGFWTQFLIVMLVIFILGFFLDFIEIAVVVVPIVAPILLADPSANITAVWLGVMIGLNIQTSFLTPPFGFALFYLRGVAPAVVKTVQMYKGVIAFILLQISALAIVGAYPPLVNYLPNRVSFLSESSPPPRNPKLQLCLEDYVGQQLAESSTTRDAIKLARGMDLSVLPKGLAKDLTEGFDQADLAVAKLDEAFDAASTVAAAAPAYRPMHGQVRGIEKQIRNLEAEAKKLSIKISRMRDESEAAKRAKLQAHLDEVNAEVAALRATIPAEWADKQAEFLKLTKAENKARSLYRRAADASYEGPLEVLAVLKDNDAYSKLHVDILALRQSIETLPEKEGEGVVKEFAKIVGAVEGAGDVKKALGKVRKALKSKTPDRDKALAEYDQVLVVYEAQLPWRQEAEAKLRPDIEAYLEGIRNTLGVRLQDRFTRDQALSMASCTAYHRDISLNF